MEKKQHVAAGEYLIEYIDKVLEAFQAGTGVWGNLPEPITLDIARRLIWREIRRVFLQLEDGRTPENTTNFLWFRASVMPDVLDLATAQERLLATLAPLDATVRCYGPRGDEHPTVFYVAVRVDGLQAVNALLAVLRSQGFEIRDFMYNDG